MTCYGIDTIVSSLKEKGRLHLDDFVFCEKTTFSPGVDVMDEIWKRVNRGAHLTVPI